MTDRIPGPRAWPFIGNMLDVKSEEGISKALDDLADIYGPVFQVTLDGKRFTMIASADLLMQVADERRFVKLPPPALDYGKGPKGLFIARGDDPDWYQAHRILSPAFGVLPVEEMFDEMKDIATQLCLKWARMGTEQSVLVTDDFTRLTLDTIGLCAMNYRFNSFYTEDMHPFVDAMLDYLKLSSDQSTIPWIYRFLTGKIDQGRSAACEQTMISTAQQVIDERRSNPSSRHDLLNAMLYNKDPKSKEVMRDPLIAANMITFLIAGHETTSGLLSFTFMQLLRHPHAYLKAQREIDDVIGTCPVEMQHLSKLPYLNAVLRETLRLNPTAPGLTKIVHPDHRHDPTTFCDGKYLAEPDIPIRVLLSKCMSDPAHFGEDAREFIPERMLESNPNFDHYLKAWKPFGNGSRSCVGQHFAWQEAVLVTAMILQNFEVNFADANYQPRVTQALTVKPKNLHINLKLRRGLSATLLASHLSNGSSYAKETHQDNPHQADTRQGSTRSSGKTFTIMYGSNTGTCQTLAQRFAAAVASTYGAKTHVCPLDEAVVNGPPDGIMIVVTASYEGQPPDNSARFVAWLESCKETNLDGKYFSVFGCGHKDWQSTLFAVPKYIDETLEHRGAKRLLTLGTCDVSQGDVVSSFEVWQSALFESLYGKQALARAPTEASKFAEVLVSQRSERLSSGLHLVKVVNVRRLTLDGVPEKRELVVKLPQDLTYQCGDYLSILPVNPDQLVKRVMAHWNLPWDASLVLKAKLYGDLPLNQPLSIYELLKNEFELQNPAARSDLEALMRHTKSDSTRDALRHTIDGDLESPSDTRLSIFEYLVRYTDINIELPEYLSLLFPLRVRQYSISSSAMVDPGSCSITYSVIRGDGPKPFMGVATNFLAGLNIGDSIHISVKETATSRTKCPFQLPSDHNTPIVMYCAGTGLAPFRGFLQQRAFIAEKEPAHLPAPAVLFVGCRSSDADRIYAEELDKWSDAGIVRVRYAFSQEPERSFGCRYISDRMLREKDEIIQLWRQGARVYICGSRKVSESVQRAALAIFEASVQGDIAEDQERKWKVYEETMPLRAAHDVFD